MLGLTAAQYRFALALAGVAFLVAAWAPAYTRRRPMSLPMVLVVLGAGVFALPGLPAIDPRDHLELTEHLTELGVIVALLGAGLKLDRRVGWRRWSTTWRLLSVAMLLTIAGTALLGWLLGLAPATALLLGAVLAPTDPVLAADVQVGEPSVAEGEPAADEPAADEPEDDEPEDEVRFGLTSEAGLNDGLAFPFVYAAVALAVEGGTGWIGSWVVGDVLGRVTVGVVVGWAIGWILGRISFAPPGALVALAEARDGFVALAATFVAYGVAELVHGYGFLAVFVAALALRDSERGHEYHRVLHDFAGEVEQLLTIVLLTLLGGAAVTGMLAPLTWRGAATGLALIVVIRPVSAWISLRGSRATCRERRALSFFGIRGVGSVYYLAFALGKSPFRDSDELWATVIFTILASVVIHGVTATPVMDRLDRRRARRTGGAATRA